MTVALSPDQLESSPTQEQGSAVTFDGLVTIDMSVVMTGVLTMQADVSTGWSSIIAPQTVEVMGPGEVPFQVTVYVPPGTSALVQANVHATASLKLPGLAPIVSGGGALITVAPAYQLTYTLPERTALVERGEEATFTATLVNGGNDRTTFLLSAEAQGDLQTMLSHASVEIGPDDAVDITVRIGVPDHQASGDYIVVVHVEVASEDGDAFMLEDIQFMVRVMTLVQAIGPVNVIVLLLVVTGAAAIAIVLLKQGRLKLPRVLRGTEGVDGGDADEDGPDKPPVEGT